MVFASLINYIILAVTQCIWLQNENYVGDRSMDAKGNYKQWNVYLPEDGKHSSPSRNTSSLWQLPLTDSSHTHTSRAGPDRVVGDIPRVGAQLDAWRRTSARAAHLSPGTGFPATHPESWNGHQSIAKSRNYNNNASWNKMANLKAITADEESYLLVVIRSGFILHCCCKLQRAFSQTMQTRVLFSRLWIPPNQSLICWSQWPDCLIVCRLSFAGCNCQKVRFLKTAVMCSKKDSVCYNNIVS